MKHLKVLTINLIIFFIMLTIAELLFGRWRSLRLANIALYSIPGLAVGQSIQYDTSSIAFDIKDSTILYQRGASGYRQLDNPASSPKDIILTIGGSTTDQRYLSLNTTWQYYLQSLLRDRYLILNGGVDGQSTFGHEYSIVHWHSKVLPRNQVKHIIVYQGVNEPSLLNTKTHTKTQLLSISNIIRHNSFLYGKAKQLYYLIKGNSPSQVSAQRVLSMHSVRANEFLTADSSPRYTTQRAAPHPAYSAIFTSLLTQATSTFPDAKVHVIQQPAPGCLFMSRDSFFDLHPSSAKASSVCKDLSYIYAIQRNALSELNHPSITLTEAYLDNPLLPSHVYDYIHTNSSGSRAIAKYLYSRLYKHLSPST